MRKSVVTFFALLALVAVLAVPIVYLSGAGKGFEVDAALRSDINTCIASQAGSGKQGIPFASVEVISAKQTKKGAVVYCLARIQSFKENGSGDILWESTAFSRVSLTKNGQTGNYEAAYCMFPRTESYDKDVEMMFPRRVRTKLARAADSQQTLDSLDSENVQKASKYIQTQRANKYYVALMTSGKGNDSFEMWTGLLVNSAPNLFFTVNVQNLSETVLCFGSGCRLAYRSDFGSEWQELELLPGHSFGEGVTAVTPGQTQELLYNLNAYIKQVEPGEYRLTGEYYPSTEVSQANLHSFELEFIVNE